MICKLCQKIEWIGICPHNRSRAERKITLPDMEGVLNNLNEIYKLREENAKLKELVKWAIEYVDMGADGAINTDFENDFLARAKKILEKE